MAITIFKDLCLDAADPVALGRFWGRLLGLADSPDGDGDAVLRGADPHQTIWVNLVPEPKTVKHRVHLDVWPAPGAEELEGLGARTLSRQEGWTVMADPEGGEFCVFPGEPRDPADGKRIKSLVVDSADPARQAAWWAEILDAEAVAGDGFWSLRNVPGAPFETWDFVGVSEPKTVKNRWHWDVTGDPADLVRAGAKVLRAKDDEIAWTVMADPEDNEFCVFGH
ncbi:VOC family protein [Actinocorallia sp. A-T 12471]|uniref:VOC family protein n=1 Tax=Actinocorallia sp. A-T 12471 TaxID=3089813 RepID=UPI0029CCCE83|nr:VOC family protein [Actinocorallia sp. A-T 12471]MDX6739889.1 VOC family protein [Actinocorallia sp. A-T 12471]